MTELLRACIESGQVDPAQIEAHRAAGEIPTPSRSSEPPVLTDEDVFSVLESNGIGPVDPEVALLIWRLAESFREMKG